MFSVMFVFSVFTSSCHLMFTLFFSRKILMYRNTATATATVDNGIHYENIRIVVS